MSGNKRGRTVDKNVPEEAKKILEENKVKLGNTNYRREKKTNYDAKQWMYVYNGYNMLENLILVRHFIQKKYEIDIYLLEILLYLAPKNYFSLKDWREMPKPYKYRGIKIMFKSKYIGIAMKGKNMGEHIYCLSSTGKYIVVEFYKMLSGEKPIPESNHLNPMALPSANAFDKKKMDLIKKLNLLPAAENLKKLY